MASPWYIYTHWVKNFVLFFFLLQLKTVLPLTVKSKGTKNTLLFSVFCTFRFYIHSDDQTIERLP